MQILLVFAALVAAAAVLALLLCLPRVLVDRGVANRRVSKAASLEMENEIRKTVVQVLGGIAIIVPLYFGWRELVLSETKAEIEIYGRSVELLDSDELAVRIGGVHALSKIADTQPNDSEDIATLFAAFVRTHSNRRDDGNIPMSPDIAAALQSAADISNGRYDLNFDGSNLKLADLRPGTNLSHASFVGADLRLCSFIDVDLLHCDFSGARLEDSNFSNSIFDDSSFLDAKFDKTRFLGAKLDSTTSLSLDTLQKRCLTDAKTTKPPE